ncbi:MAG TPA: ferrous iron transport protein A [Motilibacteraceae bacterium]|nr:ferrous iron transport protein A [Motilibacteraceae bacterium]
MDRDRTLADVPVGGRATLTQPLAPAGLSRRLAELGLRRGRSVEVLQRTSGGGRVVGVDHGRIALDRRTLAALPVLLDVPVAPATPA